MSILAAVDSTGYKIVLLLHVVTAVVAFAPAFMSYAVARAVEKGDRGAAEVLVNGLQRLALPAMVLVGILGYGLVGMSDKQFTMSQAWVSVAGVAWIALILVTVFLTSPAAKALAAGTDGARSKLMMSTGITHLLFVVLIVMMVFKPGA